MCSSYVRINSDGKCDLIELYNNNFNFDETGKEYKCLYCNCLIGVPDKLEYFFPEFCPKCKSNMKI